MPELSPTPWVAKTAERCVVARDGTIVCKIEVPADGNVRRESDNLAVISFAPAMFDLCEQLLETVSSNGEINYHTAELTLLDLRTIAHSIVSKVQRGAGQWVDINRLGDTEAYDE